MNGRRTRRMGAAGLGLAAAVWAVLAAEISAQEPPPARRSPRRRSRWCSSCREGCGRENSSSDPPSPMKGDAASTRAGAVPVAGAGCGRSDAVLGDLDPGEISDGGKGFTAGVPFDPAWTETLDRIDLRARKAWPRSTGRTARGRCWSGTASQDRCARFCATRPLRGLPPALAADSARLEIIRGLPRPPPDPPERSPAEPRGERPGGSC